MNFSDVKEVNINYTTHHTYDKVDYIENTSTTASNWAIDLGFIPTSETEVELNFRLLSVSGSYCSILGDDDTRFKFIIKGSSGFLARNYFAWASGNVSPSVTLSTNTDYTFKVVNGEYYIDDTSYLTVGSDTTTSTLKIFKCNNTSALIRVYSLKVKKSSLDTWHTYYPVKRDDNITGLYDSTDDIFYTSSLGTFTYSTITEQDAFENDVPGVYNVKNIKNSNDVIMWGNPSNYPYRQLDYIGVTSQSTSLLNLGINLQGNSDFSITYSNAGGKLLGGQAWNDSTLTRTKFLIDNNNGELQVGSDASGAYSITRSDSSLSRTTKSTIKYKNGTVTVPDGDTYSLTSSANWNPTSVNIRFFGQYVMTSSPITYYGYGRIHEIHCDGYSYYPVQRKSDNAYGFIKVNDSDNSIVSFTQYTNTYMTTGSVVNEYIG